MSAGAGAVASTDQLAPAEAARRRRMLAVVALATLGALTVWFSTNAISEALGSEFGFGDGELAWLTIAVQFGFVAGTLLSALANLTERMNARRLFAIAAVLAALANIAPIGSDHFTVWLLARFLTGVFLGGVYPPAMHVVSGWYRSGRGLALGVVIGALTLGSGSPHLMRALLEGEWRLTMLAAGALAATGGLAMWWAVEDGPYHSTPPQVRLAHFWRGISGRAPLLALSGYLGHMWELYAMWAWLPVFLAEVYEGRELPLVGLAAGSVAAFGVFALGAASCVVAGAFAERYGRTLVTSVVMVGSGAAAAVIGFTPASLVLVTVLAALWGATVVADSAQFSAAMTELADERYRGSALALQTGFGFLLTAVTIRAVPLIESAAGWGPAFAMLAAGPALGTLAMLALRRRPEAALLAGGRR
ncbi:MAG: MFS transporter [Dehalococcoidia bacterium]|nr:MFS transporter [Dehalococcoidia bacterium]